MKVVSKNSKLQASTRISDNHTLHTSRSQDTGIAPLQDTSENYAPNSTAERSRSGMEIPTSLRGENDCFHNFLRMFHLQ